MSIIEYNLRIIILSIIISIFCIFISFELIKEGKRLGWFKNNFNIYKIRSINDYALLMKHAHF